MPDKLLYLDIDMMANGNISELYNTDITEYEYAAGKRKIWLSIYMARLYNAGMLLLNMKKIKETGLLEKSRELIKNRKLLFADKRNILYNNKKIIITTYI